MKSFKLRVGSALARNTILAMAFVLVLVSLFTLFPAQKADAAHACKNGRPIDHSMSPAAIENFCAAFVAERIDRTHMRVYEGNLHTGPRIYTDNNLDGNYNFKNLAQSDPCQSEIWAGGDAVTTVKIIVVVTDSVDRNCQLRYAEGGTYDPGEQVLNMYGRDGRPLFDEVAYKAEGGTIGAATVQVINPGSSVINFRFTGNDTIEKVDGQQKFTRVQGDTFAEEGSCPDLIVLTGTRQVGGQTVRTGEYRKKSERQGGACGIDETLDAYVTSLAPPDDGTGGGGGPGEEPEDSCASSGSMGWIMCPVIKAIDGALNWVDEMIQSLLEIDSNYYDNDDLKGAFAAIRNIAYIILVPVLLVMVIGTALGFDFISAYTVKRALPRFIVAVIFIALSYEIGTFLIGASNALGSGTLGIMTAPFADGTEDLTLTTLFEGGIVQGLLTGILAVPALVIIIWLFGGTLLLFAGTAFLVLLLRQIFIVVLLLAAPLAILAWIFPGNDKMWKSWWSSFSKLLLMYPLIMAIIAMGRIFAFTIHESNPAGFDGAVLQPLMTLIAYMIPYAFIPFTFKFAGGLFATVSGMANDRSKGLFDRQRQSRANKLQRTSQGNLFKNAGDKGLRSKLNTFGAGAMNVNKAGLRPWEMRSNMKTALADISRQQALEAGEKNESYQSWAGDDDANKAANEAARTGENVEAVLKRNGYGGYGDSSVDQKTAKASVASAAARIRRTQKEVGNDAFKQMTWLSANKGGTAFATAEEAWDAAAKSSGGDDAVLATLVAKGRSDAMAAGRVDIGGAGFGDTFMSAKGLRDGTMTKDQARARIHRGVIESQGPGVLAHASMKPTAIKQLVPELKERLSEAAASGDQDRYDRELAVISSIHDSMASSSPQNARIIADQVLNWDPRASAAQQPLAPGVAGPVMPGANTIQDDMDSRRQHSRVFQATHRELTAAQVNAGAVGGGAVGNAPPGGNPPGAPPPVPSDVRLKRSIQYLHTTDMGINMYRFQYLWSDQIYVGVMAQDLIDSYPEALSTGKDGFYRVNYDILGLEMLTIEEWEKSEQLSVR